MPREVEVKSILNKTKKRDSWFLCDYTLNLYSSCSFNCLYCYIRGSKYGTNLETSLSVKTNAIELLEKQLHNKAKKGQYGFIVLSSATDPYLQIENKYELTREALKIIAAYKFPVHIITKSDLLHEIDKTAMLPPELKMMNRGTIISFSFSTIDDNIGKIFEPGATLPSQRLMTLDKAIKEKFLAGVSLMPLMPFISDTTEHLALMFSTFKKLNTNYLLPATITLFGEGNADSKTLMLNAVRKHYPELEMKWLNYFRNGSEMPGYYKKAFDKKMKELLVEYNIPGSILKAGVSRR